MSAPSEDQLNIIFYYGAYPLWKLLDQMFGIDIREVCARVAKEEPVLATTEGDYRMRVVDYDYPGMKPIGSTDSSHDQHLTFLVNCVNVVFSSMSEALVLNGVHVLRGYSFQLDSNYNMELVWTKGIEEPSYAMGCQNKLGVVFQPTHSD